MQVLMEALSFSFKVAVTPLLACLAAAYSCQPESKVSIFSNNFRSVRCPVSDDCATTEDDVCKSMVRISCKVFM